MFPLVHLHFTHLCGRRCYPKLLTSKANKHKDKLKDDNGLDLNFQSPYPGLLGFFGLFFFFKHYQQFCCTNFKCQRWWLISISGLSTHTRALLCSLIAQTGFRDTQSSFINILLLGKILPIFCAQQWHRATQ